MGRRSTRVLLEFGVTLQGGLSEMIMGRCFVNTAMFPVLWALLGRDRESKEEMPSMTRCHRGRADELSQLIATRAKAQQAKDISCHFC
jgi:hypothetical protein